MTTTYLQDAQAGMAWWNSLTEADRRFWLSCAMSAVPADAWAYYQKAMAS